MRILFFIESLRSGGKERRLVELIKGLQAKDSDIEMMIVLTKDEIHYKDVLKTNIKVSYAIRKVKKDPKVFLKFYKIVKNFKPDIIHVWGNLVAIYSVPTKFFLRIPMINSQIADAPDQLEKSLLNHKISFPFSDKIIANSFAGLKAYKAPTNKSEVIYNGFDFNRVNNLTETKEVRKSIGIKTNYIVGMVASFSNLKDYSTYIKAAILVLDNFEDVTFLCIGSGNSDKYKKMVKPEYKDKILFLGKQTNVESIMNVCNLGVLTTYTEGISNALLEFMSLKKTVVVAGAGGCGELIENNVNGFLVGSGDYKSVGDKILKLLLDNELIQKMGNNAFLKVKNNFEISIMINSFYNQYKKLIK